MTNIIPFEFESNKIRTVIDKDGSVLFVAKDIAEALGYKWQPNLLDKVPEEWKGIKRFNTLGGKQEMLFLSEAGLYFFCVRSDKPKALPLQKWIAGDVLPSIRKTGSYSTTVDLGLCDYGLYLMKRAFIKLASHYGHTVVERDIIASAKVYELCRLMGNPHGELYKSLQGYRRKDLYKRDSRSDEVRGPNLPKFALSYLKKSFESGTDSFRRYWREYVDRALAEGRLREEENESLDKEYREFMDYIRSIS